MLIFCTAGRAEHSDLEERYLMFLLGINIMYIHGIQSTFHYRYRPYSIQIRVYIGD